MRTPQARLGWIALGIAVLGIGEFCVAALADAVETHRHLFIFQTCTDLTICFAIAAVVAWGGRSCRLPHIHFDTMSPCC